MAKHRNSPAPERPERPHDAPPAPRPPAQGNPSGGTPSGTLGGSLRLNDIGELIEMMSKHDLEEVQIEQGPLKLKLKRRGAAAPAAHPVPAEYYLPQQAPLPPPTPEQRKLGPSVKAEVAEPAPAGAAETTVNIPSPMVGTFYAASSPNDPPYIEAGREVGPETVVCIIEAMKVMNEIKAGVSGRISKVLVQNGQAVEYNQALFTVKPS